MKAEPSYPITIHAKGGLSGCRQMISSGNSDLLEGMKGIKNGKHGDQKKDIIAILTLHKIEFNQNYQ